MARTHHQRGNFLHGIGNRAVRQAINAITVGPYTAYENTTAAGTATGPAATNWLDSKRTDLSLKRKDLAWKPLQ